MESISQTQSLYSQIIFRCSKCSLIPFIEIDNSSYDHLTLPKFNSNNDSLYDFNKEPKVILKCENNHENKILISKLNEECHKINLNGVICDICKKGNERIYYCIKCFNFYCNEHKNTHSIIEEHYLISKNKLDLIVLNIIEIILPFVIMILKIFVIFVNIIIIISKNMK